MLAEVRWVLRVAESHWRAGRGRMRPQWVAVFTGALFPSNLTLLFLLLLLLLLLHHHYSRTFVVIKSSPVFPLSIVKEGIKETWGSFRLAVKRGTLFSGKAAELWFFVAILFEEFLFLCKAPYQKKESNSRLETCWLVKVFFFIRMPHSTHPASLTIWNIYPSPLLKFTRNYKVRMDQWMDGKFKFGNTIKKSEENMEERGSSLRGKNNDAFWNP